MTTLHPTMAAHLAPFAPRRSAVHQDADASERRAEEKRIADQQHWLRATSQGYDFPRDFSTVEARL